MFRFSPGFKRITDVALDNLDAINKAAGNPAKTVMLVHEDGAFGSGLAKFLAAEAAWEAGNACIDCHGGYGYAEEYDVERKFREARLYKTAPVNQNLVMAYVGEHVLGMPRSY